MRRDVRLHRLCLGPLIRSPERRSPLGNNREFRKAGAFGPGFRVSTPLYNMGPILAGIVLSADTALSYVSAIATRAEYEHWLPAEPLSFRNGGSSAERVHCPLTTRSARPEARFATTNGRPRCRRRRKLASFAFGPPLNLLKAGFPCDPSDALAAMRLDAFPQFCAGIACRLLSNRTIKGGKTIRGEARDPHHCRHDRIDHRGGFLACCAIHC